MEGESRKTTNSPSMIIFTALSKVKVKVSLCWTEHHAMQTYWGIGDKLQAFFDLGTRWGWVVSFTPRLFYPRERAPGTHWIGGWVGPRAGPDMVLKWKTPSPCRESDPNHPIVQPVDSRYGFEVISTWMWNLWQGFCKGWQSLSLVIFQHSVFFYPIEVIVQSYL
jgi:hypothetical protein